MNAYNKTKQASIISAVATATVMLTLFALFTTISIPYITYFYTVIVVLFSLTKMSFSKAISSKYFLFSLLLIVYVSIVYFLSSDKTVAKEMYIRIISQIIMCIVMYLFVVSHNKSVAYIQNVVTWATVVLGVLFLFNTDGIITGMSSISQGEYYTLGDNNRNTIGVILSIGSLFAAHLGHTKKKLYYLLTIALAFLSLLTGSRKSLIAIIIGIILLSYLYSKYEKNRVSKKIGVILLGGLVLAVILYAINNNPTLYNIIGFRIDGALNTFTGKGNREMSAVIRLNMIDRALEMFRQKPILGWGIEGFKKFAGYGAYSHNNYTETLVSFGVLGFFMFYGMKFKILMNQIKLLNIEQNIHCRQQYCFLIVMMIVTLILDFGEVSMNDVVINFFFAWSAGVTVNKKIRTN